MRVSHLLGVAWAVPWLLVPQGTPHPSKLCGKGVRLPAAPWEQEQWR